MRNSETAPRRQRFELDDRGFDEVPHKYRRYYRKQEEPDDRLAPNEVVCPVCNVVIRSPRELRVGDRLYCMACMTRVVIVRGEDDHLEAETLY
jgi:hypothetical protein